MFLDGWCDWVLVCPNMHVILECSVYKWLRAPFINDDCQARCTMVRLLTFLNALWKGSKCCISYFLGIGRLRTLLS